MEFSPDMPLEQALDTKHAAAYLGTCSSRLARLRKTGKLAAFLVGREWRYPMDTLHQYRKTNGAQITTRRFWDPNDAELPVKVVARLLGKSVDVTTTIKYIGILKSYEAADVRAYLLQVNQRKMFQDIKYHYEKKIFALQSSNHTMARKLSHMLCAACERKTVRRSYPVGLKKKQRCPKNPNPETISAVLP